MASELSRKVHNIMAREMGQLGKFIVNKQCSNLAIDPENIHDSDLPKLAKAFGDVMLTFGGAEKAKNMELEIKKLATSAQ